MWMLPALAADPEQHVVSAHFEGPALRVEQAERAYRLVEGCTGRPPTWKGRVLLREDLPALAGVGAAGLFRRLPTGQAEIQLVVGAASHTVAHEVAHLWIHEGPPAVREGRTEVLTACVQAADRLEFGTFRDDAAGLEVMPDLRAWSDDALRTGTVAEGMATLGGYTGSFRLFRVIATVLPPALLFQEDMGTWESIEQALQSAGATALLDVVRGGALVQRAALSDADLDGLPALAERLAGSDATRWDSDGDGWWDGAPPAPEGAVVLPRDGSPVCLPRVPSGLDRVMIRFGGRVGLVDLEGRAASIGPPGALVSWDGAWSQRPGGAYLVPPEGVLAPNPRCAVTPHAALRATADVPAGVLQAVADAVPAAWAALGGYATRGPARLVASFQDTPTPTHVPSGELGLRAEVPLAALVPGTEAELALFLVLGQHAAVPVGHDRTAVVAAAFAELTGKRLPQAALAPHAAFVQKWRPIAKRCPTGWQGVFRGECVE